MKQLYQQLRHLMPTIFWSLIAIVCLLMLVEHSPKNEPITYADKIQHALVFLMLSIAGCLGFKEKIGLITIGLTIFGGLIEILQATLTTTRTGDINDWLADIVGIIIGFVVVAIYRKFKPKRLQ